MADTTPSSVIRTLPVPPPAHPSGVQVLVSLLEPPQAPDELGRLGGYRVIRKLGEGGMSIVLLAVDASLQRHVALKVMRPESALNPTAHARFLQEARAIATVKNDHVVTIHQVGETRGIPFLAMEHLQGLSLEDWITRGKPLSYAQIARMGKEMAKGLAAAHACGLVHRDLKPANVWLEKPKGRVKLLDFGMALCFNSKAHLTHDGLVVGTPAYMSPEQARGGSLDARTDLFSLGVVLYQLCAGQLPFIAENPLAMMAAILYELPPHLGHVKPDVPRELTELVMELLAKRPEERPASALAVADRLLGIERLLLAGAPTSQAMLLNSAVSHHVATMELAPVEELAAPRRETRLGVVMLALLMAGLLLAAASVVAPRLGWTSTGGGAGTSSDHDRPASLAPPLLHEVLQELRDLNPRYRGEESHRSERDAIVELSLPTDHLSDIAPLRKLPGLRKITLRGSAPKTGVLTNLAPLRGLLLVEVDCAQNPRLTDLSPLRGMPLRRLVCSHTSVADVSPVKDAPLQHLHVAHTRVSDLSALPPSSLEALVAQGGMLDLQTAAHLRPKALSLDFDYWRDAAALRALTGLTSINGDTPSVFWRTVDDTYGPFLQWRERTKRLPASARWQAVLMELQRQNPKLSGETQPRFVQGKLVQLHIPTDDLTEIAPLQALTDLRELVLEPAKKVQGQLSNVWALKGMPLRVLVIHRNPIADLRPLVGMPLQELNLSFTAVTDLAPVQGLKLTSLRCWGTRIRSLAPLRGMPLEEISLIDTQVTDYSLLAELPLRRLWISGPDQHGALFQRMPTLVEVNYKPKSEYLK